MEGFLTIGWQIVLGVGSLAGIFSTCYVLLDRFYKHYPTAIIVPRPLTDRSVNIVPILQITNPSERPILIAWDDGDRDRLHFAKDYSERGILQSLLDGSTVVAVSPKETRDLVLFKPRDYDAIDPENQLDGEIRWKFAQPTMWRSYRKIRITIRKQDLDYMLDGYQEPSARSF